MLLAYVPARNDRAQRPAGTGCATARPGDFRRLRSRRASRRGRFELYAGQHVCVRIAASVPDGGGTRARSGQLGDTLLLDAAVSVGGISAEAGFASVDPLIFIDPSFPGASRYSILVSPGVGNESSSAPEPSGLALVALGALMVWRFRPAV